MRHRGDAGRLVRRAHRPALPALLRHRVGHPARHPRFRRELRLAGDLPLDRRLLVGRPRDDACRLPTGVPACRGELACRGSSTRGGGAQPGSRAGPHLLDRDSRPSPAGHPRRSPAGWARGPGRIRCLRDPGVSDPDHRDLQRVRGGVQPARRLRALAHPRPAGRPPPGQRRPGPGPGSDGTRGRGCRAPEPTGGARPDASGRARRCGRPGRPRPRGARGLDHLPHRPRRQQHLATRVPLHRDRQHLRLRGGLRCGGHLGRAADRPPVGPFRPSHG